MMNACELRCSASYGLLETLFLLEFCRVIHICWKRGRSNTNWSTKMANYVGGNVSLVHFHLSETGPGLVVVRQQAMPLESLPRKVNFF